MNQRNKKIPTGYTKTKEGYITAIEELLEKNEKLPLAYYRLSIGSAYSLYNALQSGGLFYFLNIAQQLNLPCEVFASEVQKENIIGKAKG